MKRLLTFLLALALPLAARAQSTAGNALAFTGGYAQVPHAADLDAVPLTITAWIKTTASPPLASGIVNKYVASSLNGYSVHLENGRVFAWYFSGGAARVYPGGAGQDGGLVNDGAWHHIAYTVDAAGGKLYVDGVLKNSQAWEGTPAATTTAEPLRVGRYPGSTDFAGQIDEVSLWNVARTQAQIQAGMTAGTEPGLLAYYRFDESSGTAVTGSRAGGIHPGTLTGTR